MQSEGNIFSLTRVTGTISSTQKAILNADQKSCSLNQKVLLQGDVVYNDNFMYGVIMKSIKPFSSYGY